MNYLLASVAPVLPVTATPTKDDTIDLSAQWTSLWRAITADVGGGIFTFLSWIGLFFILYGIGKFFWDKKRGGGNSSEMLMCIVIGAVLAGPQMAIPAVLNIVDFILNMLANFFNKVGGLS